VKSCIAADLILLGLLLRAEAASFWQAGGLPVMSNAPNSFDADGNFTFTNSMQNSLLNFQGLRIS
jgi:hypothetical protein